MVNGLYVMLIMLTMSHFLLIGNPHFSTFYVAIQIVTTGTALALVHQFATIKKLNLKEELKDPWNRLFLINHGLLFLPWWIFPVFAPYFDTIVFFMAVIISIPMFMYLETTRVYLMAKRKHDGVLPSEMISDMRWVHTLTLILCLVLGTHITPFIPTIIGVIQSFLGFILFMAWFAHMIKIRLKFLLWTGQRWHYFYKKEENLFAFLVVCWIHFFYLFLMIRYSVGVM